MSFFLISAIAQVTSSRKSRQKWKIAHFYDLAIPFFHYEQCTIFYQNDSLISFISDFISILSIRILDDPDTYKEVNLVYSTGKIAHFFED